MTDVMTVCDDAPSGLSGVEWQFEALADASDSLSRSRFRGYQCATYFASEVKSHVDEHATHAQIGTSEHQFANPITDRFDTADVVAVLSATVRNADSLNAKQAIAALHDLEAVANWLDAARAQLVVVAAGPTPVAAAETKRVTDRSIHDIHACSMGAALGISATSAMSLASMSRNLVLWLPSTLHLMRSGAIGRTKARLVSDGATRLYGLLPRSSSPSDLLLAMRRYERIVTRRIVTASPSDVRKAVAHAHAIIASTSLQENHQAAVERRYVEMVEVGDGMSILTAYLPTLEATRIWQVLEYTAKASTQGCGSHRARMADALASIIDGTSDVTPESRNEAAVVQVVVGLDTLLGASNSVAQLPGGGWLTPQTVRELAERSALRRLIVDERTGTLIEYGRTTYRPPAQLRDHVKTRDQVCRAPGCHREARYADIDHIVSWDDGGGTDVGNLASLCRRHHLLKTFEGWDYELLPDGAARWRLPNNVVVDDGPRSVIDPQFDLLPPF